MSFNQTAAPAGWTKDTTAALNDSIMRIVTGAVGSGGSTAFSTFNGQTATGAYTLSISDIPSHNHTITDPTHAHTKTDPGHAHVEQFTGGGSPQSGAGSSALGVLTDALSAQTSSGALTTASSTTGISYAAASTGISLAATGGGGSHSHSITTAIKYNDFIIASKN
jgi:hypothetical protein